MAPKSPKNAKVSKRSFKDQGARLPTNAKTPQKKQYPWTLE